MPEHEEWMSSKIPGYHVPVWNRVVRRLFRPTFRGLFHLLGRVRVTGRENVPKRGVYIVATNHISLYEPALVLAFWPRPLEALGASDIWDRPGQSLLVRLYRAIPVHRGEFDRQLLRTATAVIAAGYPLVIMPEGGRSHTPGMRRAARGVAYLADKTGALVVPAGITGTTGDYFQRAMRGERPQVEMHIGKPLHLPPVEGTGEVRRSNLQANTDLVMQHIARLLPPEYRGFYAIEDVADDGAND
jgi:1-acyl-sn-glycerol-3-phosphate acyltransferase